ncbi:MAG: AmmeMemoRadiSam system protein A [Mariprofundales bacterium]|nr:AmmeMemoRadiSam system protein A [Mariprofundales bacterium]
MSVGGQQLPALARTAIAQHLGLNSTEPVADPGWQQPGASFVTLTKQGNLRGCIGSLEAWRPLIDDVRANAEAAAFQDPRFPALTASELSALRIEVSVLTAPTPLATMNHADLLTTLRPQIDGVIVSADDGRRATFLPQVWEQLPNGDHLLQQLKMKAGLAPDADDTTLHYAIYQVEKFSE